MRIKNYQEIAQQWRNQQTEKHRVNSGVVLIWNGAVYGWKNSLRDAKHERPAAIAVDVDGHAFVAEGGNDKDGAKCWVSQKPSP